MKLVVPLERRDPELPVLEQPLLELWLRPSCCWSAGLVHPTDHLPEADPSRNSAPQGEYLWAVRSTFHPKGLAPHHLQWHLARRLLAVLPPFRRCFHRCRLSPLPHNLRRGATPCSGRGCGA